MRRDPWSGLRRRARKLWALALCLAASLLPTAHAERLAPGDEPAFLQVPRQLAVKILHGSGPTAQFLGTGFAWVKNGRALAITNAHVAQKALVPEAGPGSLQIGFPAPTHWHPAVSMLSVPGADLAVIETAVQVPLENPYTLGTAALEETVYSIGYDEKDFEQAPPLIFRGKVVGLAPALFPSSVLLINLPVPPDAVQVYVVDGTGCEQGASGSMMLNSRGELFAYNAGRIEGGLCIGVAIGEMVKALSR